MEEESKYSCTAVIGGLGFEKSLEGAKLWMHIKSKVVSAVKPLDVFAKMKFKEIFFAKYADK